MGLSIGHLLIVLLVVLVVFGAKRLRTLGADLGGAVKGFREAMSDDKPKVEDQERIQGPQSRHGE